MKPSRRTLVVLLLLPFAPVAAAQNQTWIHQLGTSSGDGTHAAAPDGSGGVYAGGQTYGALGGPHAGNRDAWVARHDGAGTQLWIRQLGTSAWDDVKAVVPDGSSGVYVTGLTAGSLGGPNAGNYDAWVAHYDGGGNQLWIRQIGTSSSDIAEAAAPDSSGGAYVSGYTDGSLGGPNSGSQDAWVARYDSAGTQLWIRQLGTAEFDWAVAAAPDGSGGVYLSGTTEGSLGGPNVSGYRDAWVARYDNAGNQLWIRQLGTSSLDVAQAAAPDGSGGVYVGGQTYGSLGGPHAGIWDAWLAHYDGAGNQLWIRQLGTSSTDYAEAAAPDGSGGVYLSGHTMGSLGGPSAGGFDAWLAHYDSTGNQLWIRQFGTHSIDYAYASSPDGSGGVYMGGGTQGSFDGPNAGYQDAWVARYTGDLGTRYCTPALTNSTGLPGVVTATGSGGVIDNDVTLVANQLPPQQFGYFLAGQTQGSFMPPGSQGILCLSGNIGRYNQIATVIEGPTGSLQLDLAAIPVNPLQPVQPGDTWNFQCWYRDAPATSNFTDAVSVTFF